MDCTATRACPSCAVLCAASRVNPTCGVKPGNDDLNLAPPPARGRRQWRRVNQLDCVSKRHDDAVERRVAIDQVHPLRGDEDAAVDLQQAMEGGAGEQPLAVATVFD